MRKGGTNVSLKRPCRGVGSGNLVTAVEKGGADRKKDRQKNQDVSVCSAREWKEEAGFVLTQRRSAKGIGSGTVQP
jgi:hypothetical protein